MPQTIFQISNQRLQPAAFPQDARMFNGKFGASKTFPTGCVIGRKTSDGLLYPCVAVNDVQTITPTGTATAGTFTISILTSGGLIATTTALAYNASIATIQTALDVASGVANGVVATSAGSAAPFSTPTALILTFSGTGYTNLPQPLVTVDISAMTGTTAAAVANVQPNRVQTITPVVAASAGHFAIEILRPTGVKGYTGPIAYNASLATIQTALDLASGVANGVVATSAASAAPFSTPTALILTFSGTGFAGIAQPLVAVQIGGDVVGTTDVLIDDITVTRDGTEVAVGFVEFGFKTDANSLCYLSTVNATADILAPASMTMPYFIAGTCNTADLIGFNNFNINQMRGSIIAPGIIRIP